MSEKRLFLGFLLIMGFSSLLWAYSSGPPNGRAGEPPSGMTCITGGCHNSFDLNAGDGSLSIDNIPNYYAPGFSYTITVSLSDPAQSRWGFELTVMNGNNHQAGTLEITDNTNTQLSDNAGTNPDYVKQTRTGTYSGTLDGPVTWSFDWTAPSTTAFTLG